MQWLVFFFAVGMVTLRADCKTLESTFANMDEGYRKAKTISSPIERYEYYYRYITIGTTLMVQCRTDRRRYAYTEIVRKLRGAERERSGLRQAVVEAQWVRNNVKPVIREVWQSCTY